MSRARHMKMASRKSDEAQDKAMIKAAVHKHEKHDHPGKPLTELKHGGKAMGGKSKKRLDRGGKIMFHHDMKREKQTAKDRMDESHPFRKAAR